MINFEIVATLQSLVARASWSRIGADSLARHVPRQVRRAASARASVRLVSRSRSRASLYAAGTRPYRTEHIPPAAHPARHPIRDTDWHSLICLPCFLPLMRGPYQRAILHKRLGRERLACSPKQARAAQTENYVVTPLRKRTLEGAVYTRNAKIEALLAELERLPPADLVARCLIQERSDPGYVPSECVLYLVRATRADNSDVHFERFYKILIARVLSALPKAETLGGGLVRVSQTKSRIRDAASGRFVGLLAADRRAYSEKLDYFEVRFDGAVANLRRDAQDQAWREEKRSAPLEFDSETNEPSVDVEKAAGSYDPFGGGEFGNADYRSRMDTAIDRLPPEQIRIIEMLRQGFHIDSKDPEAMTIAKALGKSEKTIRLHRDRAFATLRAALSPEKDHE